MVTAKRRHCAWIKTIMIYIDNLIFQQSDFQCYQQTQQVVVLIREEESQIFLKM